MTAAALGLVLPAPAQSSTPLQPERVYMEARAAAISGDHDRAAQLLARLVEGSAASQTVARQAVLQAISAGNMPLALRLSQSLAPSAMPIEARLLRVAAQLRSRDPSAALPLLAGTSEEVDIEFLRPFVEGWLAAERKDLGRAIGALNRIDSKNLLNAFTPEHRALILLKFRRVADAQPFVTQALERSGPREHRLRLAFADAYLAAGDRARALAMVAELGTETGRARDRVLRGRSGAIAIDDSRTAFSELLVALALELNRVREGAMPVSLAQVARFADPDNSSAATMLGMLLESRGRVDESLAVLRSVPDRDPLAAQARDGEVRALLDANRKEQALAVARRGVSSGDADVSDFARLGDVLSSMKRFSDSADAYGRAVQLAEQGRAAERWPLLLLRASALEQGGRWPEARQALGAALALAPDEPLILNYLGYAKLERGEDLDAAEAMIRQASALAPDDASITDSLGWALYKRGRLKEAIEILTRAATGDPGQAEIHEHLGDALYKAGNRFEARYAWEAALVTADEEIAERVKAKLQAGLTSATAAP